jgi:hypothetical protein
MLRSLFRGTRSVRVPFESGTINVQRVAIERRSKPSPLYRLFTVVAVTYFAAKTINYIYPETAHGGSASSTGPGNDQGSGRIAGAPAIRPIVSGTYDGEDDDEVLLHLMLPIWIRMKKPGRWQADDPTWLAYKKLHADPERCAQILDTVKGSLVLMTMRKHRDILEDICPTINSSGHRKVSMTERWTVAPPLHPPPTYEVPCIFVGADGLKYGWRELPSHMGAKVSPQVTRIAYPHRCCHCRAGVAAQPN